MLRHFIPFWRFLASKVAIAGLAACLLAVAFAYAGVGVKTINTRVNVTVGEQIYLSQLGSNVIFQVRLSHGVTAKLWGDNVCGSPKNNAMTFTASGSYVIPIQNIPGHGEQYVCALSSDGTLRASVQIIKQIPTISVACTPGTIAVNSQTTCTATLTGKNNPGSPTGSVTFSSNGSGAFAPPNSCTLTSGANATASCSVKYTPSASGTQVITANYASDGNYASTSGSTNLSVYGPASKLAFSGQPSNTQAGFPITPAVQVQVQDANGAVVANSTASITIAIGANLGGGTLSGTKTVSAVNGVATFSNLSINKTGNGYTLTASSTSLTGATSSAFNITAPVVATVTISGSMEGNLPVNPGDTIRAGYDFTMPGSHPAATVMVSNAMVKMNVICPNGSNQTLTIPLPSQTYSVLANDNSWVPSGDQNSSLVYQGSLTAPANLCGGHQGHAPNGATFTASFESSDDSDALNVRFHYSDNTAGGWSATVSAFGHSAWAPTALKQAIAKREPPSGLVHHADGGPQYARAEYVAILEKHRMIPN